MNDQYFSAAEWSVLCDADFHRHKNSIDPKINALFAQLKAVLLTTLADNVSQFPSASPGNGKVARGERYLGIWPWRAMDFPAIFDSAKDFYTFRTVVVWGHHLAFHWIVSGKYLTQLTGETKENLQLPDSLYFDVCYDRTPWEWLSPKENLHPVKLLSVPEVNELIRNRGFLKLSAIYPLSDLGTMSAIGNDRWREVQEAFFQLRD